MIIHFICTGNVYRSRLAETYLRSLKLPAFGTFSSGIGAMRNLSGPISWYAQRIIQNERLVDFASLRWQQTTQELLEKADLTIFMQSVHHQYCKEAFDLRSRQYEVWSIPDLDEFDFSSAHSNDDLEIAKIRATENTYIKIKAEIHEFINKCPTWASPPLS